MVSLRANIFRFERRQPKRQIRLQRAPLNDNRHHFQKVKQPIINVFDKHVKTACLRQLLFNIVGQPPCDQHSVGLFESVILGSLRQDRRNILHGASARVGCFTACVDGKQHQLDTSISSRRTTFRVSKTIVLRPDQRLENRCEVDSLRVTWLAYCHWYQQFFRCSLHRLFTTPTVHGACQTLPVQMRPPCAFNNIRQLTHTTQCVLPHKSICASATSQCFLNAE